MIPSEPWVRLTRLYARVWPMNNKVIVRIANTAARVRRSSRPIGAKTMAVPMPIGMTQANVQ